jgi:hypothetical protein
MIVWHCVGAVPDCALDNRDNETFPDLGSLVHFGASSLPKSFIVIFMFCNIVKPKFEHHYDSVYMSTNDIKQLLKYYPYT